MRHHHNIERKKLQEQLDFSDILNMDIPTYIGSDNFFKVRILNSGLDTSTFQLARICDKGSASEDYFIGFLFSQISWKPVRTMLLTLDGNSKYSAHAMGNI